MSTAVSISSSATDHLQQTPRVVRVLDASRALSDAMCEVLVAHHDADHAGEPFDFEHTMVLVPGGRLAHAIERNLLARAAKAGVPLIAPTIVTPLMLAGRFVEPKLPVLSALGAKLSWRETLDAALEDAALAKRVAALFSAGEAIPAHARPRIASRLARLASETATSLLSAADIVGRLGNLAERGDLPAIVAERWSTLAELFARRSALLARAGACDRDELLRDAVLAGEVSAGAFQRIVVLFADPEPVQRQLLACLGDRGVRVEVCVHTRDGVDAAGFPVLATWEERLFASSRIPSAAIRMAEGPDESGRAVVDAIRAIPAPRQSDEIAVMAPDDETRRAVERALAGAGTRAVRTESRKFAATRLGTLLARLHELLADPTAESLSAFIRHADVARRLAGELDEAEIARYRAETLVGSWRDEVASKASGAKEFARARKAVLALVAPLEAQRSAHEWARPLRAVLADIVGEDAGSQSTGPQSTGPQHTSRAFPQERARTVRALDRALGELADVPQAFASALDAHEVLALLNDMLASTDIRGDGFDDGVSVVRWLDAGIADERHLVLAGFADGLVPEGAVSDPLLPDDARRRIGMPSSLRRAARDAWILDGILDRATARGGSLSFVVPRRTAEGDPQRPSRFLLRVAPADLPARVVHLFEEPKIAAVQRIEATDPGAARFPRTPPIAAPAFESIRVTAFKTYIKCPYLFLLQNEPRLKLDSHDERARELDPRGFGTLLHAAVEGWGREELTRPRPTTDAAAIERELCAHLDAWVRTHFPKSLASSVRVQIELVRRRLRRLATLQAEQAKSGWRVHAIEMSFEKPPAREGAVSSPRIGGEAGLYLTGRIDRVDVNESTGEFRALDYKSAADADPPTRTHRILRGPNKDQWKDLQLPLYRVLLASLSTPIRVAPTALGYINLAPNDEKSGFAFLECSDDQAERAEERAREIVASVMAGEFTPSDRVPVDARDPLAAVWGLGLRITNEEDEPESGAESGGDSEAQGGGDA